MGLRPGYSLSIPNRSCEKRTRNILLRLHRLIHRSSLFFIYLSRLGGAHLQTAPPPDVRRWLRLAAEPLFNFWGCAPGTHSIFPIDRVTKEQEASRFVSSLVLSFIYLSRISGAHSQTAPPPDVRRWLRLAAEPSPNPWGCAGVCCPPPRWVFHLTPRF